MSLQLTNTFSGKKEKFVSLVPNLVRFYLCGVTVYDYCHLGHARAYVSFDMVRRYLMHRGYDVKFVQNFTDIDDKIIKRAHEAGQDYQALSKQFIEAYHEDIDRLFVLPATLYTNATDYIVQMQDMIEGLIASGHAYIAGGDVCFSVENFKEYGKLSKKVLDDLISNMRVESSDAKRSPADFVLWKAAKPDEPFWESPWGKGRPGWHIECSAMAMDALGETIDIHAGGEDLMFPHHENEIAQSESFTGKRFAKYWMHNGFVTINHEKMSKSLHNFIRIRDVLEKVDGESLRFYLLRVQYRNPLHFSEPGLKESQQSLARLREAVITHDRSETPNFPEAITHLKEKFYAAMDDDFNAAEAIGVLFEMLRVVNTTSQGAHVLYELGQVLGLFNDLDKTESVSDEIEALIEARQQARASKNFAESDRLRDELRDVHGVVLEDGAGGVRWKRVG